MVPQTEQFFKIDSEMLLPSLEANIPNHDTALKKSVMTTSHAYL